MDIQLEKVTLLNLLKETERLLVTTSVKNVFVKEKKDWFEELPDCAKEGIEAGLEDIRNGRVYSFEEAMKILRAV